MGFDVNMRVTHILLAAVLLSACHSKPKQPAAPVEDLGAAQVTSIDDVGLPIDKSDQITSIDAATDDSSGMPREGGGVIEKPKPEEKKTEEPAAVLAPPVATPPPLVSPPPVMENPLTDAQ